MMFEEDDEFSLSSSLSSSTRKNKKKKSSNKRRFSDDQIRSLESIFESETKLEPQKKMLLARELGLEPRQVAIWFQNKRARRKSKQLEQDYDVLLDSYTNLASQFEALKKENQALTTQVQKLKDMIPKSAEVKNCCNLSAAAAAEQEDRIRENTEDDCALRPVLSLKKSEDRLGFVSDEDSSIKTEYFGIDEEPELVTMVEPADSSLTSPENWASLGTDDLLDQSCSSHQWWDFWS